MRKRRYPYFRMSNPHCSMEVAQVWLRHLEEVGIPAAIARTGKNGNSGFSVWRIGAEACEGSASRPNSESLKRAAVIEEVHAFSKLAFGERVDADKD